MSNNIPGSVLGPSAVATAINIALRKILHSVACARDTCPCHCHCQGAASMASGQPRLFVGMQCKCCSCGTFQLHVAYTTLADPIVPVDRCIGFGWPCPHGVGVMYFKAPVNPVLHSSCCPAEDTHVAIEARMIF